MSLGEESEDVEESEDISREELGEALRAFADRFLELPFLVEYPDTKGISPNVLYGLMRSIALLVEPDLFPERELNRCRRTIGGLIPRFPQRMLFYTFFKIPINKEIEYTLQLIDDQLAWTAPWHRGFGPLTQRLVELVTELHAAGLSQCAAYLDEDQGAELDAAEKARKIEYEIWDLIDDGVSERRHLDFLAGLPI